MYSTLTRISASQKKTLDRLGYWLVNGDKIFINKIQAATYAEYHNTTDIKYCIGNFDHCDWSQEPTQSLKTLYKLRAQQLRDTYQYLVLSFSGGADSLFMLHAFIENNIYPDEVVSFGSFTKGNNHQGYYPYDTTNSEVFLNQKIIQDLIISNNIPFRIMDHTVNYQRVYTDPEWVYRYHSVRSPHSNVQGLGAHKHHWPDIKNGCRVIGLEKPDVVLHNNSWQCYFQDGRINAASDISMYYDSYSGLAVEKFYTSGDLPELTIKQSYCIAEHFDSVGTDKQKEKLTLEHQIDSKDYKNITNKLLYGDVLDQYLNFSIGKNTSMYGYRDTWIWSLPDHDPVKINLLAGWQLVQNTLSPSWFNNGDFYQDLIANVSNFYTLRK